MLGAGGGSGRQQVQSSKQGLLPIPLQGDQEELVGLRDRPFWPPPLATPNSPVPKHRRPMAQAHAQSTASHSYGDLWPKRDWPWGSLVVCREAEQAEVQSGP